MSKYLMSMDGQKETEHCKAFIGLQEIDVLHTNYHFSYTIGN